MADSKVYMDYNATTPLEPEVITSISEALTHAWGNPSSSHDTGRKAKAIIDGAREHVATMIGAKSSDIIFTSGGTEADNMIIMSAVQHFNDTYCKQVKAHTGQGDADSQMLPHIITSHMEHPAVNVYLEHLKDTGQTEVTYAPLSPTTGRLEVGAVLSSIQPNTVLVTVMLANNETGIIQPVRKICEAVRSVHRNELETQKIFVHTDAAQAIGKIKVDVLELGVDYLTVVGHKFYGPRIGAMFALDLDSNVTPVYPMFFGGGQERNFRPGTENTGMIAGLGKACEIVYNGLQKFSNSMEESRNYLEEKLVRTFGERVHFNGKFSSSERLPNTCNVSILGEGCPGHEVLARCQVLQASVGAACHAQNRPSAILLAIGVQSHIARNALRLSLGRYTSKHEVDAVIEDLKNAVNAPDAEG